MSRKKILITGASTGFGNITAKLLAENGHTVGENLQRTGKQVNGKSKVVTDGPFIQAKEMVNGYLIVIAKDINEAVEISKGYPIFEENERVEVRPVQKLEN